MSSGWPYLGGRGSDSQAGGSVEALWGGLTDLIFSFYYIQYRILSNCPVGPDVRKLTQVNPTPSTSHLTGSLFIDL